MKCVLDEFIVRSPVGLWDVQFCEKGLHWVKLLKNQNDDIDTDIEVEVVSGNCYKSSFVTWLSLYFHDINSLSSLPIPKVCTSLFQGCGFREKCWSEIYQNLPAGSTATYGEIASRSGSKRANQAVGTAMKMNPVSLVIPCHRVVKSGGSVGHYSGGTRDYLKVWLLNHESRINQGKN